MLIVVIDAVAVAERRRHITMDKEKKKLGISVFFITQSEHNKIEKLLNHKGCNKCKLSGCETEHFNIRDSAGTTKQHFFCKNCGRLILEEWR